MRSATHATATAVDVPEEADANCDKLAAPDHKITVSNIGKVDG